MKVVILCGGQGTRIRDVQDNIPKPMIRLGRHPILWHIMKYYSCYGYNDFVLCLGYKGDTIKDYFLNYKAHTSDCTISLGGNNIVYHNNHNEEHWNITLAETGEDTMTGGRIKKIEKYIDGDFMLTYGDGVGNIDLGKLQSFHFANNKVCTVTGTKPPGRFGEISCDSRNIVTGFNEKPQSLEGLISGGFFVCSRDIFKYIPPWKNYCEPDDLDTIIFEQGPINNLVHDKELVVYKHDGFWQPMDTYRDYHYLNNLVEGGTAPWMIW